MVENINNLMVGLNVAFQPYNLMIIAIGLILGIIVGVLPGLGGANGVAIDRRASCRERVYVLV